MQIREKSVSLRRLNDIIQFKELEIMYLSAEKKQELFSQYGKSNKDTGSAEFPTVLVI